MTRIHDHPSPFQFCSLSSSSRYGNAYVVSSPSTHVLIDYGLSRRRLERYLKQKGISPDQIDAIFISHEHSDHSRALNIKSPFHVRHNISKLYSATNTWKHLGMTGVNPVVPGTLIKVGDMRITGIPKPHDAAEPLAFSISHNEHKLGIITDLGTITPAIVEHFRDANHLIIESNYDTDLQNNSGRPWPFIKRITGEQGHLSNEEAGHLLQQIASKNTENILLAHLSLDCNTPDLALAAAQASLEHLGFKGQLRVAPPDQPSHWFGCSPIAPRSHILPS